MQLQEECRQLFNCRCIMCGKYSETVHEIVPRANGSRAVSLDNMVVLCAWHHEWAHVIGTKKSGPVLLDIRKQILLARSIPASKGIKYYADPS